MNSLLLVFRVYNPYVSGYDNIRVSQSSGLCEENQSKESHARYKARSK